MRYAADSIMKRKPLILIISSLLTLSACGGGGSSSSTTSTNSDGEVISALSTGYALPSELSAVPSDNSGTSSTASLLSFSSNILALADFTSDSDYKKAKTKKYVEERALEQFDIIEQVLNAVGQTNYADPAVINLGPYTAMVTWVEDQDGREVKTLEPWVVDSRMIVVNGQDVNRVLAWIEEPDYNNPGSTRVVKAEFKIYTAATINADGSYANYGEWDLNVKFNDTATDYFSASATIDNTGKSVVKVHEIGHWDGPESEMKGVLVRGSTDGYGKVSYPDYDACYGTTPADCSATVPSTEVAYAYNTGYMGVQPTGASVPTYKDRDPANAVEITHRYGLFYSNADANAGVTAGDNVTRHKSFGFPIKFRDSTDSYDMHSYYGAWQGRHEIWGARDEQGNALLAAGDTVTKDNYGGSQTTAQTYVVSPLFNGTLTKRTLVDGSLSDIQDIPVETWVNKNYDLTYNGTASAWQYCGGYWDWSTFPDPTCRSFADDTVLPLANFTDFASLIVGDNDRKFVNIGRWDSINMINYNYKYLDTDPGTVTWSGAGFYEVTWDPNTNQDILVANGTRYTPTDTDKMYINIGGSIYIEYTTGGWVKKTLLSFDTQTWTPTFDPAGDVAFDPEMGREYYINNQGASFVVKRINTTTTDSLDYEVKIELQTAANPTNTGSILPTGTSYLATPWQPDVHFGLVTNAADTNFMKLIYLTDDPNTQDVNEASTTTVRTQGEWGLQAFNVSDQPLDASGTPVAVDGYGLPIGGTRPVEFNWEYSMDGGWGTQQFLCDPDCSQASNYLILDNPILLQPITVANGAGVNKTLSLQFDGWMHGLPDMYRELEKNNFEINQAIADKVINIPADTLVTDGVDGVTDYYVKPLEVSVHLSIVTDTDITNAGGTVPDVTQASSVNLIDVPDFTDHNMGAMPTGTEIKYVEGNPVTQ